MTRQRSFNLRILSFFSLVVATLTMLIAFAASAQQGGNVQPAAKDSGVLTPAQIQQEAVATLGPQPASFLPAVLYDSGGTFATSVAVADVNGDGKPDLLVAGVDNAGNPASGGVGVLLGNGDGTFQPAVTYDTGGVDALWVAVADVNNDGMADLVVVNLCMDSSCGDGSFSSLAVLLGNGDGTFQPPVAFRSGGSAISLQVADVNSDRKLDVIVANSEGSVGVLLGNGDGTFQSARTYPSGGVGSNAIVVVDVNGDGKPDLAVANCNCGPRGGSVGVLLGNGDGTFQPALTYPAGGTYTFGLATGDLNGDGKPDLVVTNTGPHTVAALLGNGDGTFQRAGPRLGGEQPHAVAIADVNGDGQPDLVVDNYAVNNPSSPFTFGGATVLLNIFSGDFERMKTLSSLAYGADAITVADVNGDGRPDILLANGCMSTGCMGSQEGSVSVLLNNTPDTTPPVVTLSATPKVLWPPSGKLVPVTASGTITDTFTGVNVNSASYAVRDEYGEIQPTGPITLGPGGAYSFTVLLQASRRAADLDGRRYTINVRARDNAGNRGSHAVRVIVPQHLGN